MAKNSRFKYAYRDSASKLHKAVGDCLRSSLVFGGYEIYQEYPVTKIHNDPSLSAFHFDWVIPKLKIVWEAHGLQHYKPVKFGGISDEDAEVAFHDNRHRDMIKKEAALEAGWIYVEIPYSTKITEENLIKLYETAKLNSKPCNREEDSSSNRDSSTTSDYESKLRERARDYRKAAYRKAKERLKSRT
jgi:hypothetical protein